MSNLISSTSMEKNSPQQNLKRSDGPIAILWDMENCPVPTDVSPEDVSGNIHKAIQVHPIINGRVTIFSAYGDFNAFPRRLREGCQRTGVKLIDVPNGRKDAADKAILVDMFLFALDNPPPSSIMLISGDVDFSHALHVLGQRGYTVILVVPSRVGVLSSLSNAGSFVWDWAGLVRGEGFLPPSRFHPVGPIGDNPEENDLMWVQPGDLTGLKGQLVKLLELSGGHLPLGRLPAEYQKSSGRPLYVSEYGALKLVDLLKTMSDVISIEGKGARKLVCLKKCLTEVTTKHDMKGKGVSSDEFSDDERSDEVLNQFRNELQEILVSYSCRVFLGCFEAIYQQRYKRLLDLQRFGVCELEDLFDKVKDVVVVHEEPGSRKKFLVVAGC